MVYFEIYGMLHRERTPDLYGAMRQSGANTLLTGEGQAASQIGPGPVKIFNCCDLEKFGFLRGEEIKTYG
jgi:hypothetical protein